MSYTKRLIDANALKEQIAKEIHTYWTNGTGGYCLAEDAIADIDNAPTVDAVEVVRCKDCKHRENLLGEMCCPCYEDLPVEDNHFCAYGERREGE